MLQYIINFRKVKGGNDKKRVPALWSLLTGWEGRPFMEIRSGDMRGARDLGLPPAVRETGRPSVGNCKECRLQHDYASFPGPQPLPRFAR